MSAVTSHIREKKRALNQVWAAAENYGFDPPFLAYRADGSPDLYRNLVIGLSMKCFDRKKLENFFLSYAESARRGVFDDISWLGIENAVFEKELPERPVLPDLRRKYAEEYFAMQRDMNRQQWMAKNKVVLDEEMYRWSLAAGRKLPLLTPGRRRLASDLAIGAEVDTDELIRRLNTILKRYFHWNGSGESHVLRLHISAKTAALMENLFHTRMEREAHLELRSDRGAHGGVLITGQNDAPSDHGDAGKEQTNRAYIEACFGRSILRGEARAERERELCRNVHEGCHIWITDGVKEGEAQVADMASSVRDPEFIADASESPEQGVGGTASESESEKRPGSAQKGAPGSARKVGKTGFRRLSRQELSRNLEAHRIAEAAARQRVLNQRFVSDNEELIRSTSKRLSAKLSAELEDFSAPLPVSARSGRLDGRKVWRLPIVRDPAVFRKEERDQRPDLTVEVLLDASASRMDMQESVAAQGYVLAESLRLAGIPCAVTAFRSVRGFTVLQILKRKEERDSGRILNYFAAGWNRDGLALRAAAGEPCLPADGAVRGSGTRRILLILTDAGPNDDTGIVGTGGLLHTPYEGKSALDDTKKAVLENADRGVITAAIFLGPTINLTNAEQIYGRNFVRIHRIDQMADAVGNLLPELLKRAQ